MVELLKTYINLKKIEILIIIWLHRIENKLYKLKYEYKNIYKNIFINKHKLSNIIEKYKNFLQKIKKPRFYIIKFEKNDTIKPKIYLSDYAIKNND